MLCTTTTRKKDVHKFRFYEQCIVDFKLGTKRFTDLLTLRLSICSSRRPKKCKLCADWRRNSTAVTSAPPATTPISLPSGEPTSTPTKCLFAGSLSSVARVTPSSVPSGEQSTIPISASTVQRGSHQRSQHVSPVANPLSKQNR
jgi:hypothetical protein